jgi:general secretion pathway protein K
MRTRRRQQGAALLTAILVVTIAVALAAGVVWDMQLDLRRAESRVATEQGFQYALGAEAWASRILQEDAEQNRSDHPGEPWATQLAPLPLEGGTIQGRMEDLQGRFNLNNLLNRQGAVDAVAVDGFRRLLLSLDLDIRLADRMADWLDRDVEPVFPDGAEDGEYLSRNPPFRAANRPVTSASEVLLVYPELGREGYERLRPFITALPRGTPININTAQPPVLLTAAEALGPSEAERIVEDRPEEGWEDLAQLGGYVPAEATGALGVSSEWFRLAVRVDIGSQRFTMYSLLHRDPAGTVQTVFRSFADE